MLKTELRNENSTHIDKMTTVEMLSIIQKENENAVLAVSEATDSIAKAIDEIDCRMKKGGRLFYVGCGTSGRLGVLDASECPPTFGVPDDVVIGIIAGGDKALRKAVENSEDNYEAGKSDLKLYNLTESDSVIGISVAGGADYVTGALEYAASVNALTIALTCNENSKISKICDIEILTDTGAEVITGSTRMKAGTAHKMVLNMISTSLMVKAGCVYENLMINLKPSNKKLTDRMVRIVQDITDLSYEKAEKLLKENDFNIRKAINNIK